MKLVIGFGNPGRPYLWTRHNFGALTLDLYAKTRQLEWQDSKKFNAQIIKTSDAIFVKSELFYNEVGLVVRKLSDFYKIDITRDLLVVCDDINLDFGKIRYRRQGSAGGNNGLKSLISHLGTDNFARLRLGTDSPLRATLGDSDFVLAKFTPEEKLALPAILSEALTQIDAFLAE